MFKLHSKQVSLLLSVAFTNLDKRISLLHNRQSAYYQSLTVYGTGPWGQSRTPFYIHKQYLLHCYEKV